MKKFTPVFLLLLILAVGAFLRFYRMQELSTFLSDQAIELTGAKRIIEGDLALIGIKTSVSEVRNGAVMYYLLAPFLFLFHNHPVAGGLLQSMLSLLTVILVFILGKRYINQETGLIAGLLVSVSPILVKFSRQTMLAFYPLFFSALILFLSAKIIEGKKESIKTNIFLLGFLAGFMLQIHYSSLSVCFFILLLPFFFRKIEKINYFFRMVFGFIAGFFPIILFELRNEFFNTTKLIEYLMEKTSADTPSSFSLINYWINTIGKLLAEDKSWLVFLFIFIILIRIKSQKEKLKTLEKISLLQIFAVFIFSVFFVRGNEPHYIISAFVPVILLLAASLNYFFKFYIPVRFERIFISLLIFFVFINGRYYGLGDNHGWTMTEGWNLKGVENASKIIAKDVKGGKFNVSMVVDAQNQALPLRYFLDNYHKTPLSVSDYGNAEMLYVVAEPDIDLKEIKIWEITSFGDFTIDKVWHIQNGFKLYRLGKAGV